MRARSLEFLRGSFRIGWALFNRAAGSIAKFVMNLVVARALGAEGAGLFFLFLAWMNVLGVLGGLGLPMYTLRSVSVLEDGEEDHPESHRFVSAALKVALAAGAVMATIVVLSSGFLANLLLPSTDLTYIIRAAAIAGVGVVTLNIFTQALTGRGQIVAAMHLENTIIPLGVISSLAVALFLGRKSSPELMVGVYLAALLAAVLLARWFWLRRLRERLDRENTAAPVHLQPREMASFWGMGVASVMANNVAILALPLFATPADIGLYGIAWRMATMSVTILDALGNVFGPAFARRYARKDAAGLRNELLMSQLYSVLAFAPFVIIFVFFARPILNVIGEDFIAARQFLMILLVGQLFNSATGLAGLLLSMTHRQQVTSSVTLGQAFLTAALVFVLGSEYGGLGVAIAVTISVCAKNLVLYVLAWLGIDRDAREWETHPANPPPQNLLQSRR